MPRKTDLKSFQPEFEQLLLRANECLHSPGAEFTLQFASSNLAASLRHRMYQYFKALRECVDRPDLTEIAQDISMRTAGSALVFFRNADALHARAIREALGLSDGFADGTDTRGVIAPQSGLSSHLQKLDEIRSRKNNAK